MYMAYSFKAVSLLGHPFLRPIKLVYSKENLMIKYELTKNGYLVSESEIKNVNMDESSTYHGFEENGELYIINSLLHQKVMTFSEDWRFTQIPQR